jgi:hypothetical protein
LWCQTDGAEQNWSAGRLLANLSGCVDPILAGHQEVQNDEIGVEFFRFANGIVAVSRLATHFPVYVIAQEAPDALANDRAVIGDQNASRHV